jgi:hypothetical protein
MTQITEGTRLRYCNTEGEVIGSDAHNFWTRDACGTLYLVGKDTLRDHHGCKWEVFPIASAKRRAWEYLAVVAENTGLPTSALKYRNHRDAGTSAASAVAELLEKLDAKDAEIAALKARLENGEAK